MDGLTNNHVNNYYSDLSSEPLHNGQIGAPRYVLIDDLSPRLNASAVKKTFQLTDPGRESSGDIQLDLPHEKTRFIPDNVTPYTPAKPPDPKCCGTFSVCTTVVLASFVAGVTAGFTPDAPALLAINIPAGVTALSGIGRQIYYDRCEGMFHLLVASIAFGIGALASFGSVNGWLGPANNLPDDHHDPFVP